MKKTVMVISSVHRWDDTRIFHRQCATLSKQYRVELHAPADFRSKAVNGVNVIALPKWQKEVYRIKLWLLLLGRAIKSKAVAVHFHDPELIPVGFLIKILTSKRVIYDVHEHYIFSIMAREWIPKPIKTVAVSAFKLIERLCVPWFDAVVYTTPMVGARYLNMTGKAISIENYSKKEAFTNFGTRDLNNGINLVYLGRILDVRGVGHAIKAFKKVVQKIPDATFYVVGDVVPESYQLRLRDLIQSLDLEDHVILTGFKPHMEAIGYLKRATCGIVTFLPHQHHKACLPNKLFEYMASGLPVVASNFELYNSVILDAGCGITVDPENIDQIADAIIQVHRDEAQFAQMSENGVNAFQQRYNWEMEERKLLALYGRLLQ